MGTPVALPACLPACLLHNLSFFARTSSRLEQIDAVDRTESIPAVVYIPYIQWVEGYRSLARFLLGCCAVGRMIFPFKHSKPCIFPHQSGCWLLARRTQLKPSAAAVSSPRALRPSCLACLRWRMTYSYVIIVTVAAGTARIMLVPMPA